MQKMLKLLGVIGLIVGAMGLQACRVRSGVVIGDNPYHGNPGWHRWCGYDYWGRYYCTRYSPVMGLDEKGDPSTIFTSHDERVARVSEKYGISHYAGTYVVRAVLLAEKNDMSGVADLGLDKKDLENIYSGKSLSPEKMDALSKKLLMPVKDTEKLATEIAAAIEADNK